MRITQIVNPGLLSAVAAWYSMAELTTAPNLQPNSNWTLTPGNGPTALLFSLPLKNGVWNVASG
jgi:hypothetical protein